MAILGIDKGFANPEPQSGARFLAGAVALGDLTAPAQPQAPADPAALPAFLDAQALAVAKHPAGGLVGRR